MPDVMLRANAPVGPAWRRAVLALPGLIAYWRLGEASSASAAADEVGRLPGTYQGSPTLGASGAIANDPTTAMSAAGVQYMQVLDNNLLHPQSLTVAGWIYYASPINYCYISRKYTSAGWGFRIDSTHAIQFFINTVGTGFKQINGAFAFSGAYHFYVGTYDAASGNMAVYYDGLPVDSGSAVGVLNSDAGEMDIGAWGPGAEGTGGKSQDVFLLDRAMTATEVAALYAARLGTIPTDVMSVTPKPPQQKLVHSNINLWTTQPVPGMGATYTVNDVILRAMRPGIFGAQPAISYSGLAGTIGAILSAGYTGHSFTESVTNQVVSQTWGVQVSPAAGTYTAIQVYMSCGQNTRGAVAGVFTNSISQQPVTLLAQSAEVQIGTGLSLITFTFTSPLVLAVSTTLWLILEVNGGSFDWNVGYQDAGGQANSAIDGGGPAGYTTFTSPWAGTAPNSTRRYTMALIGGDPGVVGTFGPTTTGKVVTGIMGALSGVMGPNAIRTALAGTMSGLSGLVVKAIRFTTPVGTMGALSGALLKRTGKILTGTAGAVTGVMGPETISTHLTGSITPSGPTKLVNAIHSNIGGGAVTPSGGLLKSTSFHLIGTAGALSGGLLKKVNIFLTGATGVLSGLLSTIFFPFGTLFTQALTGTMGALSGTLVKSTSYHVIGTMGTLFGTMGPNVISTHLIGTAGAVSGLVTKAVRVTMVGGTLTLAGTLLKQTRHLLIGTMGALAGIMGPESIGYHVGGSPSLSGAMGPNAIRVNIGGGALTLSGGLLKRVNIFLTGTMGAVSGLLAAVFVGGTTTYTQVLTGTMGALSGDLVKSTSFHLIGSLTPAGGVVKAIRATMVGGTLTLAGALTKRISTSLIGTAGAVSGLITKAVGLHLIGTAGAVGGTMLQRTGKVFGGVLAPTGVLTLFENVFGGGIRYFVYLTGTLTPTGSLAPLGLIAAAFTKGVAALIQTLPSVLGIITGTPTTEGIIGVNPSVEGLPPTQSPGVEGIPPPRPNDVDGLL